MHLNFSRPLFGMMLVSIALAGCGQVDRRLAEDRQTCTAMGHSSDTAEFQQCMASALAQGMYWFLVMRTELGISRGAEGPANRRRTLG